MINIGDSVSVSGVKVMGARRGAGDWVAFAIVGEARRALPYFKCLHIFKSEFVAGGAIDNGGWTG